MKLDAVHTPALGRDVYLRPGTTDEQVWGSTFTGLYHLPPPEMPAPRTVLDLGANIGLTAAHYQALWPEAQVVAVEMDADSARLIQRNAPGVGISVQAVTGYPGWGSYDPDRPAEGYSFEPGVERPLIVMGRSLRKIVLRSFESGVAEFVKMDVEGAEWGILEQGGWVPQVRRLLVELHGADTSDALVVRATRRLSELGFAARRHGPHPQAVYAERPA